MGTVFEGELGKVHVFLRGFWTFCSEGKGGVSWILIEECVQLRLLFQMSPALLEIDLQ